MDISKHHALPATFTFIINNTCEWYVCLQISCFRSVKQTLPFWNEFHVMFIWPFIVAKKMLYPDFIFSCESPTHLFLLPPKPFFQFISSPPLLCHFHPHFVSLPLCPFPFFPPHSFQKPLPVSDSVFFFSTFYSIHLPLFYLYHPFPTFILLIILPSLLSSLTTALRPGT